MLYRVAEGFSPNSFLEKANFSKAVNPKRIYESLEKEFVDLKKKIPKKENLFEKVKRKDDDNGLPIGENEIEIIKKKNKLLEYIMVIKGLFS